MSDDRSLIARLERLARTDEPRIAGPEGTSARLLVQRPDGDGGSDAVLRALLELVDETVLSASLTLVSEAEETLTLRVEGRRLRRVEAASDTLEPGALAGLPLDPEDETAQADLRALIHRFADRARGALGVVETPVAGVSDRGLSVGRLTASWSPASGDRTLSAPETLAARCGDRLRAALIVRDGMPKVFMGEADLQDFMESLSEMVWSDLPVSAEAPSLTLWLRQTGTPEGLAVGLAGWPAPGDAPPVVMALAFAPVDAVAVTTAFHGLRNV